MKYDPDKHPCARCGIATYAEFCRDCKRTAMGRHGKTARQLAAERRAAAEWDREFHREMRRIGGSDKRPRVGRSRSRKVAA